MYSSYHNSSLSVMPILTVNWLNSAIFLIFTLILLYYHTQHSTLPIILIVIVYVCDLSLEINEYCFIEFFYNSQSISYNCLFQSLTVHYFKLEILFSYLNHRYIVYMSHSRTLISELSFVKIILICLKIVLVLRIRPVKSLIFVEDIIHYFGLSVISLIDFQ